MRTNPTNTGLLSTFESYQSFFPLDHFTDGMTHMAEILNAVQALTGKPIGEVSMKELIDCYVMHNASSNIKGKLVQLTFETTPYEPCTKPMSLLAKITISKLCYNTRHEGKYIFLRLITSLEKTGTVFAIAEDEHQRAIPVQLFNQTSLPGNEGLEIYSAFVVKEPLVELVGWGEVGIRVDHASDLKCISRYNEDLPVMWKKSTNDNRTVDQWKGVASELYKSGLYAQAVECYSKALEYPLTPESIQTMKYHRAQALYKLGKFEKAEMDLANLAPDMKSYDAALYRKARTLYDLRRYRDSSQALTILCKKFPKNLQASRMLSESIKRCLEEKRGMYSFREIQNKALARKIVRLEYATYIGPIEVRPASVTGRGLFSTHDIKAGDLLLCEKAMAYFSEQDASNRMICRGYRVGMDRATAMPLARVELVNEMVRELCLKPSWMGNFMNMYHDTYKSTLPSFRTDDGEALVDSFLVHKVMLHNMLHSDTSTRDSYMRRSAPGQGLFEEERSDFEVAQEPPCGVWRMASFANHSCLHNAQHSFIGDLLIMRATKDIPAGTEILIRYRERATDFLKASTWNPFEDRGFSCTCDLCSSIDSTDERVLRLREAVLVDLRSFIEIVFVERQGKVEVRDLMLKLSTLLATYKDSDPSLPRLSVFEIKYAITQIFDEGGLPYNAAGLALECFTSFGYIITGAISTENQLDSGPLLIRRWGMLDYRLVKCWLILARCYRLKAPHLERAAREYAMLFYKMIVGEEQTFRSTCRKMRL